ncbi:MAG: FtsX-like permease family protein [Candidatus Moduliflexus flocculans]|nr:FtsX-like permease family protein [Candidatus Moduliflexus flocculans]
MGVRKAVGATRRQLILQFLGETLVTAFLSLGLAVLLVLVVLPAFEGLAGVALDEAALLEPGTVAALAGLTLLVGLVSGLFPALVLASFHPVVVLKGRLRTGPRGIGLRRALVVAQFAISITLIIATLIVAGQVGYMRRQPLGFAKEQRLVINFRTWGMMTENYEAVKSELLRHTSILAATACSGVPGKGINRTYYYPTGLQAEKGLALSSLRADHDFFRVFDIPVVAGRPFQKDIATDTYDALVLNEQGAKAFGWATAEEAVGKTMTDRIDPRRGHRQGLPLVGAAAAHRAHGRQGRAEPLPLHRHEGRHQGPRRDDRPRQVRVRQAVPRGDLRVLFRRRGLRPAVRDRGPDGRPFPRLHGDRPLHRLPGPVRTGRVHRRAADERDRHPQDAGRLGRGHRRPPQPGVREVGPAGQRHRLAGGLLRRPQVAGEFPRSDAHALGLFALAAVLALAVALLTVSCQSVRAATANPVESLRYE